MDLARRKRRRRRRQDRPPISAHLLLDERMREDVGILSEDMYADLFPAKKSTTAADPEDTSELPLRYVAIAPWVPVSLASIQNSTWTIVPVRVGLKKDSSKTPHSSVRLPASSVALQSFMRALQLVSPTKSLVRKDTPIEIRMVDVAPVGLDTVFVSVNKDALGRLHEAYQKFGGGFGADQKGKNGPLRNGSLKVARGAGTNGNARGEDKSLEAALKQAVRDALGVPKLIHAGDQLPLPLPSHPISHVAPPPVKIAACEPLSQGLLLPSTKIVIIHTHDRQKKPSRPSVSPIVNGIPEEDEDTSNEQFYSAAEERSPLPATPAVETEDPSTTDFSDSQSATTDQDDLSDDSEDMISLSAPMLPPQSSGILSSYASATPRALGYHSTSIATPGSMHSSFSASTVRGGSSSGKLFKVKGLLQKVPDDLLHPKPIAEDDEEARIFVDTSALVKIGCFSGDWVRVEVASEPSPGGLVPWNLSAFAEETEENHEWRAVKVFGLPESLSKKTSRMPSHKMASMKSSFLDLIQPTSYPTVYMSPVLLANMSGPPFLRILPLTPQVSLTSQSSGATQNGRITSSSMPPLAKEVTMLKILTPVTHDLQLQPILFASLKEYFESKRRILKTGDLIAISIDEDLGRSVFQSSNAEDNTNDELLTKSNHEMDRGSMNPQRSGSTAVAWFKVGNMIQSSLKDPGDTSVWGGVAFIDPSNIKLIQTGHELARVPPTMSNPWQYYYGMKRLPASTEMRSARAPGTLDLPDRYTSNLRRRLRELISASTSSQAIHMHLPPLAILLTSSQRQVGKATTAERACEDLGLHSCVIDAYDSLTDASGGEQTENFVRKRAERVLSCGPENTVLLIRHIEAFTADRVVTAFKEILSDSRVIIATSTEVDKIPEGIRSLFTHELEVSAPGEGEREGILRDIVDGYGIRLAPDVELSSVALKTAALVAGDLVDVINRALVAKISRLGDLAEAANKAALSDLTVTVRDIEVAGSSSTLCLTRSDLNLAVDAARKNFADAIGAPKIPNVGWDDVGGLSHVKDAVMETIQLPLARPELFAKGMKKRSGILFYGPPGTGKTLLAKAIATEFSLNFFSVKGPELLNMYIGESEANVRRVFQRARDARPCVVFFDELDSVAPKRGNQGDSGGVMDRIVSQLLAELDGMSNGEEGGGGVFVIGATNRPDLLDQALLRPGRFDKMLFLGVSDTHENQLTILQALTRKFTLHPSLSLERIASALPFTYTGADLYALCSDAMLKAITRQARLVDEKVAARNANLAPGSQHITIAYFFDHFASEEDIAVTVTEEDFIEAHKELVPSVSVEELKHYNRVRLAFEGSSTSSSVQAQSANQKQSQQSDLQLKRIASAQRVPRKALPHSIRSGKASGMGEHVQPADFALAATPSNGDEDDYVIRTEHLGTNGKGNSNGNGGLVYSNKGKGKSATASAGFGNATDGDDALYE